MAKQVPVKEVPKPPPQEQKPKPEIPSNLPTWRMTTAQLETRDCGPVPNQGRNPPQIPNRVAPRLVRRPEPFLGSSVMGRGVINCAPMARGMPLSNIRMPYPGIVQPGNPSPSKKPRTYIVNPQMMSNIQIKQEKE